MPAAMTEFLKMSGMTPEAALQARLEYQPLKDCLLRLEANYGIKLAVDDSFRPLGRLPVFKYCALNLVTTGELLQDPMTPELENAYKDEGTNFVYVGPLL